MNEINFMPTHYLSISRFLFQIMKTYSKEYPSEFIDNFWNLYLDLIRINLSDLDIYNLQVPKILSKNI